MQKGHVVSGIALVLPLWVLGCVSLVCHSWRRASIFAWSIRNLAATNLLGCLVKDFVMKPCRTSLEEAKWALQTSAYGNHVSGVKLYRFCRIDLTWYINRAIRYERPGSFILSVVSSNWVNIDLLLFTTTFIKLGLGCLPKTRVYV